MKWFLALTYLFSVFFVTGCTAPNTPRVQLMTTQLEAKVEHPLTAQVRALNSQLLQQAFFVQGYFQHGQRLYIHYPDTAVSLPITALELQRTSAETLAKSGWFDIHVLAKSQLPLMTTREVSYSLVIAITAVDGKPQTHTLTLELINNRFNTVEAQVSRVIFL